MTTTQAATVIFSIILLLISICGFVSCILAIFGLKTVSEFGIDTLFPFLYFFVYFLAKKAKTSRKNHSFLNAFINWSFLLRNNLYLFLSAIYPI